MYQIFQTKNDMWGFRLVAPNGSTILENTHNYGSMAAVLNGVAATRKNARLAIADSLEGITPPIQYEVLAPNGQQIAHSRKFNSIEGYRNIIVSFITHGQTDEVLDVSATGEEFEDDIPDYWFDIFSYGGDFKWEFRSKARDKAILESTRAYGDTISIIESVIKPIQAQVHLFGSKDLYYAEHTGIVYNNSSISLGPLAEYQLDPTDYHATIIDELVDNIPFSNVYFCDENYNRTLLYKSELDRESTKASEKEAINWLEQLEEEHKKDKLSITETGRLNLRVEKLRSKYKVVDRRIGELEVKLNNGEVDSYSWVVSVDYMVQGGIIVRYVDEMGYECKNIYRAGSYISVKERYNLDHE